MSEVENFLTKDEEARVVEAIRLAEQNTSGEIRVHIEKGVGPETDPSQSAVVPLERAVELFHLLKMDNTQQRNGVIIYVAVESHQFAIYGDKGINEKVDDDFWNCTKDIMQKHFRQGNNCQALVEGIHNAGVQLQKHFPFHHDDTDELTNEISKG